MEDNTSHGYTLGVLSALVAIMPITLPLFYQWIQSLASTL